MTMFISRQKDAARIKAKALRAVCDPAVGAAMAEFVLQCLPPPGTVIGGFWPLAGEIDTRPVLHAFAARGYEVALPQTPAAPGPLIFRKWTPGMILAAGRFKTQHATGALVQPDYLLVPLLAFDAQGNRLGYGGGFYDRTFAALPNAFRLGCAFAAQQIPQVPVEPTDHPLHAVATEVGMIKFR